MTRPINHAKLKRHIDLTVSTQINETFRNFKHNYNIQFPANRQCSVICLR